MPKRHTSQSTKQEKGQFFTKNAPDLLQRYIHHVKGKVVIDPFAGEWDLLDYALSEGASEVIAFDINPQREETFRQNTLLEPPDFENKFLLVNPPYLRSNKNKDKKAYEIWHQNDLYKCHIASFAGKTEEGIMILPTNFLSESERKIRDLFFSMYNITECDYYYYSVFPNVTTGIIVFHFVKNNSKVKRFKCRVHYSVEDIQEIEVCLESEYGWRHGKEFFDYIKGYNKTIRKWTGKEDGYLTNIVVGLLDKGKWNQGLSYNNGPPIVCGEKAFTTYQMILDEELDKDTQIKIVELFNERMSYFRKKYHGLFLSNYMGAYQKIYSKTMINSLFWRVLEGNSSVGL